MKNHLLQGSIIVLMTIIALFQILTYREISNRSPSLVQVKNEQKTTNQRLENPALTQTLQKELTSAILPADALLSKNKLTLATTQLWNKALQTRYIPEGDSKKAIFVFWDFSCPACRQMRAAIEPYIENGEVTVNWIPVSIFPQSIEKAAISIIPEDPKVRAKLLRALIGPKPAKDLLATLPNQQAINDATREAAKHLSLLIQTGRAATPTVLYNTKDGPKVSTPVSPSQVAEVIRQAI